MINKFSKFLLILLFLLVITIPVSFADNITENSFETSHEISVDSNLSVSNDDEILRANDVYFDASASSNGDGSQSRPYNYVTSSNLGNVNHFAKGTYRISTSLSNMFSFSSTAMSFVGIERDTTILQYVGSGSFLETSSDVTFSGITLKNAHIVSTGGLLTATNTIFDSCRAPVEMEANNYYDNSYGGAIKQSISSSAFDWGSIFGSSTIKGMKIDNCIFRNNYAAYGGAIYVDGGSVNISNTKFEYNNASHGGGAISAVNGVSLNIVGCEFNEDRSLHDAGGAVYLYNTSTAEIALSTFCDCIATAGSAITSLNANANVMNSNFSRNKASWEGGAIYAMYGTLKLTSSNFNNNAAISGGAVFADNLTVFEVNGGTFENNIASDTAGAIFAFANKLNRITNPTYTSNRANKYENLYQTQTVDLSIGSDDYEMIQYISSYSTSIPSKYDLRSLGQVTSVKDQAQSGSCWSFATMAVIESAILKATGKQFDLSEGNLKNLAVQFSDIGWDYDVNSGGMYPFVMGYLTSWAGPVNESQDPTDDWDVFAPLLNSVVHIQNIQFLKRNSYTDNNAIKEAIMKYGAVASEIYWSNSYVKGTSDYYYDGSNARNHAISVIGWDDSRSISGAPGKGAWIIKNSYGTTHGDGGYYYVSYYDKTLFKLNDESYNSFAIIFNDTVRYNKNYQYDAALTDYFITGNKEMWYKNTFTATGNDILQAFSTYFRYQTDWQAEIFLNDELQFTQNGSTGYGYYTIPLDKSIPLKIGDNFTISLKIKSSFLADIPISESGHPYTLNKQYFKPGVSFFSKDGITWTDFYGYESTYGSGESGHNYFNQVACIKAFTSEGTKELINTTIEIVAANATCITVNVFDQFGNALSYGDVEFLIDGVKYAASLSNNLQIPDLYLTAGQKVIQATYNGNSIYNSSSIIKTVNVERDTPKIHINAEDIDFGENLEISISLENSIGKLVEIPLTVEIGGKNYTKKSLSLSNLSVGEYTITVWTNQTQQYNSNTSSKSIRVVKVKEDVKVDFKIYDQNYPQNSSITDVGDFKAVIQYELSKSNHTFTNESVTLYINNSENEARLNVNLNENNRIREFTIFEGGSFTFWCVYSAVADEKILSIKSNLLTYVSKKQLPVTVNLSFYDVNFPGNMTVTQIGSFKAEMKYDISKSNHTFEDEIITLYVSDGLNQSHMKLNDNFNQFNIREGNSFMFYLVYSAKVNGKSFEFTSNNLTYLAKKVELNVCMPDAEDGEDINITITSNLDGIYKLLVNETEFEITVSDGFGFKDIGQLKAGNYTLTVMDASNNVRNQTSFSVFEKPVVKIATTINLKSIINDVLYGVLIDFNNNPIANAELSYVIDGISNKTVTSVDGSFRIILKENIEATIIFEGNDYCLESNTSFLFKKDSPEVLESQFNITGGLEFTSYAIEYSAGERGKNFTVQLLDENGNPLSNKTVLIGYNGKILYRTTDQQGHASVQINLKDANRLTFAVTFLGDDGHSATMTVYLIKIIKKPVTITAKDKAFKSSLKTKSYSVSLNTTKGVSADGKTYFASGKKVTLKINGKTYSAKTNADGQATFKITKLTKKGIYSAIIRYAGDTTYESSSKNVKITIK